MFNTQKLFNSIKGFGGRILKETAQYVPAALSEDKRFANAFAASLALEVVSDKLIEEQETIDAMQFIQNSPELRQMNLVVHTIEFYGKFISDLAPIIAVPHEYVVAKAKIIEENIKIVTNPAHKNIIRNMVIQIASTGNQNEIQTMNEIIFALG